MLEDLAVSRFLRGKSAVTNIKKLDIYAFSLFLNALQTKIMTFEVLRKNKLVFFLFTEKREFQQQPPWLVVLSVLKKHSLLHLHC
jgi:hypothetical protein